MATARQTQAVQRRLSRRVGGSSMVRLADQFQGQIKALTSQYETEFSQYQERVNEMMGAYDREATNFNQALEAYSRDVVDPYNTSVQEFRSAIDAYTEQASLYQSGAKDYDLRSYWRNQHSFFDINGQRVSTSDVMANPEKFGYEFLITPFDSGRRGSGLYKARPLFNEAAPVAPEKPEEFALAAPTMPVIDEFDQSEFDARRGELQQGFQRDVAARKGARLQATRRTSRTLLSGVS